MQFTTTRWITDSSDNQQLLLWERQVWKWNHDYDDINYDDSNDDDGGDDDDDKAFSFFPIYIYWDEILSKATKCVPHEKRHFHVALHDDDV